MKAKYLFYSIVLFSFLQTACKKCYQCRTTMTTTTNPSYVGSNTNTNSTSEFCGTESQMLDWEKAGTSFTTATAGTVTVSQKTTTSCN
jgi:hypothetical protein